MSAISTDKDALIAMLIKQNMELTAKITDIQNKMEELSKVKDEDTASKPLSLSQIQQIKETLNEAMSNQMSSNAQVLVKKVVDLLAEGHKQGVWGPTL